MRDPFPPTAALTAGLITMLATLAAAPVHAQGLRIQAGFSGGTIPIGSICLLDNDGNRTEFPVPKGVIHADIHFAASVDLSGIGHHATAHRTPTVTSLYYEEAGRPFAVGSSAPAPYPTKYAFRAYGLAVRRQYPTHFFGLGIGQYYPEYQADPRFGARLFAGTQDPKGIAYCEFSITRYAGHARQPDPALAIGVRL